MTNISSIIHNLRCGQSMAGVAARPYLESVESDLRKLESERAALLAVAEAATRQQKIIAELLNEISTLIPPNMQPDHKCLSRSQRNLIEDATSALANLAAVREGK